MPIYLPLKIKNRIAAKVPVKCFFLTTLILIVMLTASRLRAQDNTESNDFSYPLKLYEQEFYDLAAQQFIKFYNKFPSSSRVPEAKYYAGMSFYNVKRYSEARAEFQTLAIEYPKSSRAADAWLMVGRCNLGLDLTEDAARAFETIRLLYPENSLAPGGLFEAGKLYLQLKDYPKALQTFSIILERYVDSNVYFQSFVKTGQVLFLMGQPDQARININKALEREDLDKALRAEAFYFLGRISEQQGEAVKARDYYEQSIAADTDGPFATRAVISLSDLALRNNDLVLAQTYLTRALKNSSDETGAGFIHQILGDVYYLQEKYALAIHEYDKVTATDDDSLYLVLQLKKAFAQRAQKYNAQSVTTLAQALDSLKDHPVSPRILDIAERSYLDWLEQSNEYTTVLDLLYAKMNQSRDAAKRTQQRLELVRTLDRLERWHDVIRETGPVLLRQDNFPEKDDFIYFLGKAKEQIGDEESAAHYYKLLTENFAASSWYGTAVERLTYLQDYRLVEKDVVVTRLAALLAEMLAGKDNTLLQFELGKIYYTDLKNFNIARKQFQQTLEAKPNNPGDVHLYLGKSLLKQAALQKDKPIDNEDLLTRAHHHFKEAVDNINTCSAPDEASWLLVKTSIALDTLSLDDEKRFIETLISRFPDSPLQEDWFSYLAETLAFEPRFSEQSKLYFERLIKDYKKSPGYPGYLFKYAQFLDAGNSAAAQEIYKTIALNFPYSAEAAPSLSRVARAFFKGGKYDEAKSIMERIIQKYYYSDYAADAREQLGDVYLLAGQYEQAIDYLSKRLNSPFLTDRVLAKEVLPENLYEQIYNLASAYSARGQADLAQKYYQLYLTHDAGGPLVNKARFALGELNYDKKQKILALDYFNAIDQDNPELFAQAALYKAHIYFENGDYENSALVYKQLSELLKGTEKEEEVTGLYIISLLRKGNITESSRAIKTYKSKFPSAKNYLARFVLELGNYYRLQKNFSKAQKSYNEVKKKYKSTDYVDDAEYYLALTLITLNKIEDAFDILTGFYSRYPESDQLPAALNTLGSLYFRTEKYDNAITMFKNALTYCHDENLEKAIMSNLIKVYSLTGFWDAAQGVARDYVEKFPYAADRLDKKIVIAQAYINLNQFQTAVDYLRKIKLEADSEKEPEVQFYIGEALLKAGRYEDAIAEFVKIPLMSKKTKLQWEASALYYSGQSYEKLGRIADAVRMYQEIIKRPGIDLVLKKDAEKRINQIQ